MKLTTLGRRRKVLLAAGVVAPLALASAVYAAGAQRSEEGSKSGGVSAAVAGTCSGGAQEAVAVRFSDTTQSLNVEGVNTNVSNGLINRFVPAGDIDTFVVTFSAETALADAGPGDSIELQVLANGVAMDPIGSVGFAGSAQRESHSATFCERLRGGAAGTNYAFQATWRLFDSGGNNVLVGTLDDHTLHVETSN